jgi:hypothetical protein
MITTAAVTELINIAYLLYGGIGDAGARVLRPRIMNAKKITVCAGCQGKECNCSDTREVLHECQSCLQTFPTSIEAERCCSRLGRKFPAASRVADTPREGYRPQPAYELIYEARRRKTF